MNQSINFLLVNLPFSALATAVGSRARMEQHVDPSFYIILVALLRQMKLSWSEHVCKKEGEG